MIGIGILTALVSNLHLGTYVVTETASINGYTINTTPQSSLVFASSVWVRALTPARSPLLTDA